jgi:MYXO-CTERM domain-containing protein
MRRTQIFIAAILLAAPAPLMAQDAPAADAAQQRDDNDGNPRIGLLGLIGLIGLFGLMRREPSIHVDARHRGRNVDGQNDIGTTT